METPRKGGEMSERIRMAIARLVNRRRDTCWADLVLWAICPKLHPFREIFEMPGTAGDCERRGELPYCGKCGNPYYAEQEAHNG